MQQSGISYIVTIKLPTIVYILYTYFIKYIIYLLIFLIDVLKIGLKRIIYFIIICSILSISNKYIHYYAQNLQLSLNIPRLRNFSIKISFVIRIYSYR